MTTTLPTPFIDVMITFEKTISSGYYGLDKRKEVISKRGFYSDLFNHFAIPPEYRKFNGRLLPHGFGGDRLNEKDVIKWEYCKD